MAAVGKGVSGRRPSLRPRPECQPGQRRTPASGVGCGPRQQPHLAVKKDKEVCRGTGCRPTDADAATRRMEAATVSRVFTGRSHPVQNSAAESITRALMAHYYVVYSKVGGGGHAIPRRTFAFLTNQAEK